MRIATKLAACKSVCPGRACAALVHRDHIPTVDGSKNEHVVITLKVTLYMAVPEYSSETNMFKQVYTSIIGYSRIWHKILLLGGNSCADSCVTVLTIIK
jgi:hypothetical protein